MSSQVFEQVPHKSLREAALSAIRQAILRRDLKPGQGLMESDIAEEAGKTLARHILQVGERICQEQTRTPETSDVHEP
jgi:DNA-binding GntR family transcriptional regulator